MRKRIVTLGMVCAMTFVSPLQVLADGIDYQGIIDAQTTDKKIQVYQNVKCSDGSLCRMIVQLDTVYVTGETLEVKDAPSDDANTLKMSLQADSIDRVGVCENGYSKVLLKEGDSSYYGYMKTEGLSTSIPAETSQEKLYTVGAVDVLDYPSLRQGNVIGSYKIGDEVIRTGLVGDTWSRIQFTTDKGQSTTGYVPSYTLSDTKTQQTASEEETAQLSPSSDSSSIWAKAEESATGYSGTIQYGNAVTVSGNAKLQNLGSFRITHYCPCSICCGPYENGITSTGVTATTNHTIAVQPSQIPYGSKVVINGNVYVAEDCGGGIGTNCIDVYVADHQEACDLGVYYTDVYLVVEE